MATAKILLYTHKKLKGNKHPVMLKITAHSARKLVSIGISCSEVEWKKLQDPVNRSKDAKLYRKRKQVAEDIIQQANWEGEDLTIDMFLEQWSKRITGAKTVYNYLESFISELDNPGNADIHRTTLNRLKSFRKGRDLSFSDLTPQLLRQFEKYLKAAGASGNSISVYMRCLRSIYNNAIYDKQARRELYPFGKKREGRYQISLLEEETQSRALTKSQIQKIYKLDLSDYPDVIDARNIFIFSYLVRGIQFRDIALLTWDNVENGRIIYKREKTKVGFNVKIQPAIQKILNYYEKENPENEYIFPILFHKIHKTPVTISNRIIKVRKQVNRHLKSIAFLTDLPVFTTYWARHSYSNIQNKENNVSATILQGLLGHTTEETTQIYLDKFGNSELDKYDKNLL